MLFGGHSSRLHRLLCLDEEIALSVRGSISPFIDPGLFEMWIFLREGKRKEDALGLLDREVDRLESKGPSPLELEKAINQLELSFLHSMETAGGKAEQIGFYETVANDGAAVFDRLACLPESHRRRGEAGGRKIPSSALAAPESRSCETRHEHSRRIERRAATRGFGDRAPGWQSAGPRWARGPWPNSPVT